MQEKRVIAVDLGASSGRVMQIGFDGQQLHLVEAHRFPNIPVEAGGTLYWDVLQLWREIRTGVDALASESASVGLDTWGVDFALLDRAGDLLANPVHYRDRRTEGMMEWVFARVPRRTVFERTGIQFMVLNSLYQLASLAKAGSPALEAASTLLLIPDLFHYWLTGEKVCEFTNATTTQCFNPYMRDWDRETMEALGIPARMFLPVTSPGTRIGKYNGLPVILPASHDTGSAIVAVPAQTPNFAYISSGTWSLVGMEVRQAIISDQSYAANVTNEGGYEETYRLLKNVAGLWFVQQSLAVWEAGGQRYSYDDLARAAGAAEPLRSLFDPDDPVFLAPGDIPARIQSYCQRTGQPVPETIGQITRAIYESLALKYRYVLEQLCALVGHDIDRLHIVGGGARNDMLSQMTADATGLEVMAGPTEATALGNGIVQLIALGEIADVAQARTILSGMAEMTRYQPRPSLAWEAAYARFKSLIRKD